MTNSQLNVLEQTRNLVRNWINTRKAQDRLRDQLLKANAEVDEANNQLGKWLCPPDAACEERFNVWYGSGVLEARPITNDKTKFAVRWRKEPDAKQAIEEGL